MTRPLALAEMPQINHRICQAFQGVVQLTDPLEAQQQAPKFIFPGEHALDGAKPFLKNICIENRLASPLRSVSPTRICRNIWNHTAIENRFPVGAAIVDPIQADDCIIQVHSNRLCDAGHLRQCCFFNSGDSFRLPGVETNGAMTLQLRSQKATTLSPL